MKADSATSLVCAIVGSLLFFGLTSKTGIQHFKTIEIAVLIAFPLVAFVEIFFGFSELFVKALGRDMSLTTRTDLWPLLLSIHNAPVLGVGYESFWIGERLDQVWEVYKGLNQAHNGYLELFLNTGLVGVGLFGAFLVSSLLSMRFRLLRGKDSFVALSLAGCLMIIVYNFTEASFARLSLPWLCFLVFMSIRGEDGAHRGDAD
ncbi:MAG: O-antigen ligase family protein [Verrucomicrobiae bacterium]|nr:O-antigen ligase family protein [Verrucomicrobiae bacterium]